MAPQTRSAKTSSKENVFNNDYAKPAARKNVGNKAIKRKPLEDKSNSLSDEHEGMETVLKQTFNNFAKPAGRNNVGNKAIKRKPFEDKSNSISNENEGMETVLKQTFNNFAKPAGRNNVGNIAIKRKPLEDKSNSSSDENEGMETVLKQTLNNFPKPTGRNSVSNKAIKRKPLEDKSNSLSDENESMKTVLKRTFNNFAEPTGRNNVGNKAIKRKPLEDKSNSLSDENEGLKTVLKQTFSKRTSNRVCNKKNCHLNSSFGVLNNPKESNTIEQNQDVYEFTYDPKDEPPSQNKKRKKVTKKKRKPKPKNYFFTQNYDKNLSKTLQKLKAHMKNSATTVDEISCLSNRNQFESETMKTQVNMEIIVPEKESPPKVAAEPAHVENKEVEYDISYSPVQSPHSILERSQTPVINDANDVFLEDDITFFDDVPAASSSFITPKHLPASPWRVDMDLLHKTPPVNMCLKPDMTPAVESSFVDDYPLSNKKHVYTNILSEPFENLPQRTETNENCKQSSMLSFIKEVTVKNLKKKKYLPPIKNNSVFDEAVENKENDRNNADDAVVREVRNGISDDDSQSIHLFEDVLETVHHLKANRKSYGKAKKVTFHQKMTSDMDTQGPNDSSDGDNGYIEEKITKLPAVKKTIKKPVLKKKLSKKEEEEFEAWAADFNSMCEDVEQCPLVVE